MRLGVELDFLIIGMMIGGVIVGGPQIYMLIRRLQARIATLEANQGIGEKTLGDEKS